MAKGYKTSAQKEHDAHSRMPHMRKILADTPKNRKYYRAPAGKTAVTLNPDDPASGEKYSLLVGLGVDPGNIRWMEKAEEVQAA